VDLLAAELNVKVVEVLGDDSALVDRRLKVLLPKVGQRLGARVPEVMAAAREGRFVLRPDGTVELAGSTLRADEVEIQAVPRPGTAVGQEEGVVVVLDTVITPALRAEGDARDLARAVQGLRKEAGLALDDRIELWLDLPGSSADGLRPYLDEIGAETLATAVHLDEDGRAAADAGDAAEAQRGRVELSAGPASIALRRSEALG
jgi:isoleucyl-tRNA synthetase